MPENEAGRSTEWIIIEDCSEHNLRNISLRIPLGGLTLVCGVSGSGKSTIAHDVCFAEGQRRFMESFSAYARIFQARLKRPNAAKIDNIPPALSLEQVFLSQNPRSTVATLSDLYSPIRLLFARFTRQEDGSRPTRSHLSFNHPLGACGECQGLGQVYRLDPDKLVRDDRRTLREGALWLSTPNGYIIYSQVTIDVLDQVCRAHGFSVDIPWRDLSKEQRNVVLFGSDRLEIPFGKHPLESRLKWSGITAKPRELGYYRGIVPIMQDILERDPNPNILRWCRQEPCSDCQGLRLKNTVQPLSYRETMLKTVLAFSIAELAEWGRSLLSDNDLSEPEERLVSAMTTHAGLLEDLHLGHLGILRSVPTLSPGEVQGIRLASMLKNPISDMLYILDEPASALHPEERKNVYRHIRSLLDYNCTVLLVSHDRNALDFSDWVVEVGPGGGEKGGRLLFSGSAEQFREGLAASNGKTPSMKAWSTAYPVYPSMTKIGENDMLRTGKGKVTSISGKSGSGKSSLLLRLAALSESGADTSLPFKRTVIIDQQPLGRNSRSNPATYTGLFDAIRNLFARQKQSKEIGLTASSFSFNSDAGACPDCLGTGTTEVTLHYLSPLGQICETCLGRRYRPEVLEVKYKGLSIDDVLNLTINRAETLFREEAKIFSRLKILARLGLGYLTLGQPSSTLSGGEAQRVRLASYITPGREDQSLYLLDEPCMGLHDLDVPCLLEALKLLSGQGAAVIVTENNPLFISNCDRLLELETRDSRKKQAVNLSASKKENVETIRLEGVRTRNLKDISVVIPKGKLTVVCGPSGSGKSSLLHETLYKACQRRYAEHLSPYLRDRLSMGGHGDYNHIFPFMAALSLTCHQGETSPRSTVGTLSGISDSLRVLYSRLGIPNGSGRKNILRASDFSYNHPDGACDACTGLGRITTADSSIWIADPNRSVLDGAFSDEKGCSFFFDPSGRHMAELRAAAEALNVDLTIPWNRLDEEARSLVLKGREGEFEVVWRFARGKRSGEHRYRSSWPGFDRLILDAYHQKKHHKKQRIHFDTVVKVVECPVCRGLRLKDDVLMVTLGRISLMEVLSMPIQNFHERIADIENEFFGGEMSTREAAVCREMIPGLKRQLDQIVALGLGYLNLARDSDSLSFGELQRLRLASLISNQVNHCLFILDEVSRGLHPFDLDRLISVIKELLNRKNTVAAIDHHPIIQNEADWMIEMGPGGGRRGGEICRMGPVPYRKSESPAAAAGSVSVGVDGNILIRGASAHNLKNLDLEIPGRGIVVLCGVSGSGKTTLMREVIEKSANAGRPVNCHSISGLNRYSAVHTLHQQGGGNRASERVFDYLFLRNRIMQYFGKPDLFTCLHCQGEGETVTDLDYMGSFKTECDYCRGTGYDSAVIRANKGLVSLAEVLTGDVDDLKPEFLSVMGMVEEMRMLREFSLGYLSLNRRLGTLSAGELQRLRMVKILLQLEDDASLLLLDEPDGGLSEAECSQLIDSLRRHLGTRHAAVVVTHHPLFMTRADWLIDLGPGAGEDGGRVTAQGTPADIVNGQWPMSRTAAFLLQNHSR